MEWLPIKWVDLPQGWTAGDSFGADQGPHFFEGTWEQVLNSVYIAGDYRFLLFQVHERLQIAIRGKWRFSDIQVKKMLAGVVTAERGFWQDDDFPYFLIVVNPIDTPCCKVAGTGLTQSFDAFFSTDNPLNVDIKYLFAHELFHSWNGYKLPQPQQNEELMYWFSEGFTDYYAWLLLLRSNLTSLPEFIDNHNAVLFQYYSSPFRNVSNARIQKDYWKTRDIRKLPYMKGYLLAHEWNYRIRNATNGEQALDSLMREMLARAKSQNVHLSKDLVLELATKFLRDQSASSEVQDIVENGKTINPSPNSLGPCFALETKNTPTFEIGFDEKQGSPLKLVTGIKQGSRAELAGLRNGQEILERKISWWQPSKLVELKVKDDVGIKWIKYLPRGSEMVVHPAYKFISKSSMSSCLKWFRTSN